MKRLLLIALFVVVSLGLAIPSGAGTVKYSSFGNTAGVGDCQEVTIANLIQANFPDAKINIFQVLNMYAQLTYGPQRYVSLPNIPPPYTPEEYLDSVNWVQFIPLSGYTAATVTNLVVSSNVATTHTVVRYAANHGGVDAWVSVDGSVTYNHAIAVVRADNTGPIAVFWGKAIQKTWSWWDAHVDIAWSFTWNQRNTPAPLTVYDVPGTGGPIPPIVAVS